GDAGGEVEEEIAVHVLDDSPGAAGADERIDARVGRRHVSLVAIEQGARLRAGEGGLDLGDLASFELPHRFHPSLRPNESRLSSRCFSLAFLTISVTTES